MLAAMYSLFVCICVLAFSGNIAAAEGSDTGRPVIVDYLDGDRPGSLEMYRESYALVIGASKYTSWEWDKLDVVPEETNLVKNELEKQGFSVTVVADPTSVTLLSSIRNFLTTPHPRDTRLVLYYSGHGYTSKTDRMGYIVPVDAPEHTALDFFNKVVSMKEIRGWLPVGRAKHVLLVFDSCFSGSIFKVRKNSMASVDEVFISDIDQPGRQFITSGSADEAVPDRMDFAQAFADGLDGKADHNGDNITTASELGSFIKEAVKSGLQNPQYGVDPGDREANSSYPGDMIFPNDLPGKDQVVGFRPPADALTGSIGANLRALGDPDTPNGQLFRGVEVLYYKTAPDGEKIADALDRSHVPYALTAASSLGDLETDEIACGPDVPIDALKSLAKSLVNANVPLRRIGQFENPGEKPMRLELLSTEGNGVTGVARPTLTLDQIESLTGCPSLLEGGQKAIATDHRFAVQDEATIDWPHGRSNSATCPAGAFVEKVEEVKSEDAALRLGTMSYPANWIGGLRLTCSDATVVTTSENIPKTGGMGQKYHIVAPGICEDGIVAIQGLKSDDAAKTVGGDPYSTVQAGISSLRLECRNGHAINPDKLSPAGDVTGFWATEVASCPAQTVIRAMQGYFTGYGNLESEFAQVRAVCGI